MPGLNRKGPLGQGPMTGRRMGRCTNFGKALEKEKNAESNAQSDMPDDTTPGWGWGRGRGRGNGGGGRGMGNRMRFRGW